MSCWMSWMMLSASGGGVERGGVTGDNRTKHRCGKGAEQPMGHQLMDNVAVGGIAQLPVEFEGADAREGDHGRDDEQADHGGAIHAFLGLADGGSRQRPLRDRLVGAPIIELAEDHAGQQRLPGKQ